MTKHIECSYPYSRSYLQIDKFGSFHRLLCLSCSPHRRIDLETMSKWSDITNIIILIFLFILHAQLLSKKEVSYLILKQKPQNVIRPFAPTLT